MTAVVGVDPGVSGGIACLSSDGGVRVWRMPVVKLAGKSLLDLARAAELVAELRAHQVSLVMVEQPQTMGKTPVNHVLTMGLNLGRLEGMVFSAGLGLDHVHPATWKAALRVPKDKDAARALASTLMPACASLWSLKRDDGLAEAALIALYAARKLGWALPPLRIAA